MTRSINWLRSDRPPALTFRAPEQIILEWFRTNHPLILTFVASEPIILKWLHTNHPPTLALMLAIRATTGAALGVTTVCTSTGAAGVARGGTDGQRVAAPTMGLQDYAQFQRKGFRCSPKCRRWNDPARL